MKLLNSCYGDYSLRTGTLIIGLLDLSALLVTFWFAAADSVESESELINNSINKNFKLLGCFYFVVLLTVILLILGALKGSLWLMIPWMGTKMSVVISLPVLLLNFVTNLSNCTEMNVEIVIVTIIVILSAMAILVYSLLVVVSYFDVLWREKAKKEMEDQNSLLPTKIDGT